MSTFRVLIAPDTFKGSLCALNASLAMDRGVKLACPEAMTALYPMADGGEGSLEILGNLPGFTLHCCQATDPLGRAVTAHFAVNDAGTQAVVELAAASGLTLLSDQELAPLTACTYGTGEVILEALRHVQPGAEVTVCLGGSATSDGGTGLLRALGFEFLNPQGDPLAPGGAALANLNLIDDSRVPALVRSLKWRVICDVTNPLLGPEGSAATFGPQKGASPQQVALLEQALQVLADRLQEHTGVSVHRLPGAGAAGGCAGTLHALLGAELVRGAAQVAHVTGLENAILGGQFHLLLTGEGKLDHQSGNGKVIGTLGHLAQRADLPVVALCGAREAGLPGIPGLTASFVLADEPMTLQESRTRASALIEQLTEQVCSLWLSAQASGQGVQL